MPFSITFDAYNSVVYKCRRIPSYDLKYTLTSLSSKVDREYRHEIKLTFAGATPLPYSDKHDSSRILPVGPSLFNGLLHCYELLTESDTAIKN